MGSQDTIPRDVLFDNTGTKMYIVGSGNNRIYQYSTGELTIPTSQYLIATTNSGGQIDTTAWNDLNSLTADETLNNGATYYAFSTDGRTTWKVQDSSGDLRSIARLNSGTWQYNNDAGTSTTVSTGFDLTNVTYDNKFFDFTQISTMGSITFKPDGTKLYVSDQSGYTNGIRQYNLSVAWDISTAVHYGTGNPQSTANHIRLSDDGTQVYYLQQSNDYLYSDILSTPWDITTISYNVNTSKAKLLSISISGLTENSPQGFDFADNGSKLYMVGQSNHYIYEWSLSTAWDISTASISATDWHSISNEDQFPEELVVSTDGTKILVAGNQNDKVYEYTMSTAFDITTATYTNRFMSISATGTNYVNPSGLALSTDGMKLYYATNQEYVWQYSISGSVTTVGYGTSETWVNATNNNQQSALQQALGAQSFNRLTGTNLATYSDANLLATGNTFDLMIGLYIGSAGTSPTSDAITINYDASIQNKGAILGTDYDVEKLSDTQLKFTALTQKNMHFKVI